MLGERHPGGAAPEVFVRSNGGIRDAQMQTSVTSFRTVIVKLEKRRLSLSNSCMPDIELDDFLADH